jgi:hypothetical protein
VLTTVLEPMLFRVTPTDAATLAGRRAFSAGVALLAALIPARRATRVDPIQPCGLSRLVRESSAEFTR